MHTLSNLNQRWIKLNVKGGSMIVVNSLIWLKESSQVTSSLLKLQPLLKPVLLKLLVTSSIDSKTRKIILMQGEHAVLKLIRIQGQEEKT